MVTSRYSNGPGDREFARLTELIAGRTLRLRPYNLKSGKSPKQHFKSDTSFSFSQIRPQARVRSGSKSQMAANIYPVDIELVWVCKDCRVAISRSQHAIDGVMCREFDSAPLKGLDNMSRRRLHRT